MRAEERRGTAAILVSAASYGFLSILGKLALEAGVDVLPLAAWRFAKEEHPPAGEIVMVAREQVQELQPFLQRSGIVSMP